MEEAATRANEQSKQMLFAFLFLHLEHEPADTGRATDTRGEEELPRWTGGYPRQTPLATSHIPETDSTIRARVRSTLRRCRS